MTLIVIFLCVGLISIATIIIFRFVVGKCGLHEVFDEGIFLKDSAFEIPRAFLLGKTSIDYYYVESVDLVPFFQCMIAALLFNYGISFSWACTRLFTDVLVIKLRSPPCFVKYVMLTPRDGVAIRDKLRLRVTACSDGSEQGKRR